MRHAADRDPYVGRVLGGRYQLESLLGRGGFGAVYRARHVALDRTVAVKLNLHLHRREVIARFKREARVMAKLRHPRCVTLLDYGDEDGLTYMVQEFIDGTTLARALAGHAPMALARSVAVVDGILDALAAAHRIGVVHRDIKPGNVMLVQQEGEEDVRVLDFGIAKILGQEGDPTQLTVSGRAIGTPSYMSPEQIKGRVIGPSTDIYSTGVLLFHLLTGRKPYRGDSIFDVYRAHLEDVPPTREMGIPDALGHVIQRAMARDPSARFASVATMREALQVALCAVETTILTGAPLQDTVESGPPVPISEMNDGAPMVAEGVATPAEQSRRWQALSVLGALMVTGLAWSWSNQGHLDGATALDPPAYDAAPERDRIDATVAMQSADAAADARAPDGIVDTAVDATPDVVLQPKKKRVRKPLWRREIERARKAIREGRHSEAERRLRHAHELAPDLVLPLLELGKFYLQQRRFALAAQYLQGARDLDPTHEEVLYRRALADFGTGDNTLLYLYREDFPSGRFRAGVDRRIGSPVGDVPLPVDIE